MVLRCWGWIPNFLATRGRLWRRRDMYEGSTFYYVSQLQLQVAAAFWYLAVHDLRDDEEENE